MASSFSDENSLFNFVVKEGNGVKGLMDSGLTEVPHRFIQPPHLRIDKQRVAASSENIIIDLSELDGPNHDTVVKAIAHAAETLGFFQVVNHGIPLELLDSLKTATHQFFAQPAKKKAVYLKGMSPDLMAAMYGTSFFLKKEQVWIWKDFCMMTYTNDVDSLEFWPNECKEVALEYVRTSTGMVKRLLQALIEDLGVKLDDSRIDTLIGMKSLHMNFYPKCPNPELTFGSVRHTDVGMLTVLLQDDIGGLYMKMNKSLPPGNEEWIKVPPVHGALVINVGDTLQIISNGKYKSAEHLVRTTSTASRLSVPIFHNPLPEVKIGPLHELVARDGVVRYGDLTFQEYWNNYCEKAYEENEAP